MKYLILILALCFGTAFAQTSVSPGCPPQTGIGGRGVVDPCTVPVDPRTATIKAYWDKYAIYPSMVMDSMLAFGVDSDELESAIDYRVDIVRWLRYNKAPDALIKTWDDTAIDQYLTFYDMDVTDKWERVNVQDQLDLAARRKALYTTFNMLVPDGIAPWEHPWPAPVPEQPIAPCTGPDCVTVSP